MERYLVVNVTLPLVAYILKFQVVFALRVIFWWLTGLTNFFPTQPNQGEIPPYQKNELNDLIIFSPGKGNKI